MLCDSATTFVKKGNNSLLRRPYRLVLVIQLVSATNQFILFFLKFGLKLLPIVAILLIVVLVVNGYGSDDIISFL